jgi:hypothetical protein
MTPTVYIGVAIGLSILAIMVSIVPKLVTKHIRDVEAARGQLPPTPQQIEIAQAMQRLRDRENSEAFGGTAQGYVEVPQRVERLRQPPRARELHVPQQKLIELAGKREPVELEGARDPVEIDSPEKKSDRNPNASAGRPHS